MIKNPFSNLLSRKKDSIRLAYIVLSSFLLLYMMGCSFSLAEDIAPPANYREPPVETDQPSISKTIFPLVAPDPTQGAGIYAEKCAPCHGLTGRGDGDMASNLANPPSPLANPDLARRSKPADWYLIVTQGNLEKFMPGFASLNDRQRWDVVAYALTLSTTQDEINTGKEVYNVNCALCHGVTGAGDGANAQNQSVRPAAWNDHERIVNLSAEDIVGVILGSNPDHPSFNGKINEDSGYAIAAYIRSLSFAISPNKIVEQGNSAQSDMVETEINAATEESSSIPETITISGQIVNGSFGGSNPPGLSVKINAYQGMVPAFEATGNVNDDGTYQVPNVKFGKDYVYFAQVDVNGITFNSDILHARDITGSSADLSIEIFDSTTDVSQLFADRLHIFFNFTSPGKIQVVNLYVVSNLSDRVIVPAQSDGAVLQFDLPEGAENLQFQDGALGDRFFLTGKGFGDRTSIVPGPGQYQLLFAYDLPYDRKLDLQLDVPLPVDSVVVMVPPSGITVKSSQLVDEGQREVQGMSFQMYQASAGLSAGDSLRLSLSGNISSTNIDSLNGSIKSLLVGLGGFGIAVILGGIWLYRTRHNQNITVEKDVEGSDSGDETSEFLLDAIVTLDDLHAAGQLSEQAYQSRRADLKARLAKAIKQAQ